MNTPTESEKNALALAAPQPKTKRATAKKAKPARKTARAKKPTSKPNAERLNKKAEVIAMMTRAKGATLAEIMAVTKWQAHTVRGFASWAAREERSLSLPRTPRGATNLQDRQVLKQPFVQASAAGLQIQASIDLLL